MNICIIILCLVSLPLSLLFSVKEMVSMGGREKEVLELFLYFFLWCTRSLLANVLDASVIKRTWEISENSQMI